MQAFLVILVDQYNNVNEINDLGSESLCQMRVGIHLFKYFLLAPKQRIVDVLVSIYLSNASYHESHMGPSTTAEGGQPRSHEDMM